MATYYSSITKPDKLRPNDVYIMDMIPDELVLDNIQGEPNAPITIKPLPNKIRVVNRLLISDTCAYLHLDGLNQVQITGVMEDSAKASKPLVEIWGNYLHVQNCHVETFPSAYRYWTSEDWEAYSRKGFMVRGKPLHDGQRLHGEAR